MTGPVALQLPCHVGEEGSADKKPKETTPVGVSAPVGEGSRGDRCSLDLLHLLLHLCHFRPDSGFRGQSDPQRLPKHKRLL